MKRTMIMTLAAAGFALPVVATAGSMDKSTHATQAEAFKSLDTNGDGFISMEEANGTPHAAKFATLDKNGDGKLSHKELAYTKGLGSAKDLSTSTSPSTSTSSDQPATQPGARAEGVTTSTPTESRISKGN